ncbi:hypothetical protein F5148DRAFT_1205370 [Russula earlei]|uniref:Uncharacterized protein n=1 Tax=Russula earlei TaxID=71964 RepID=A0ACC0U7D1_9AGAM|nr:hypothetical protein F5148DRAFT_1205370 [Russula earlei]
MSRLRLSPTPTPPPSTRQLRVVAAGTLFLTHRLSLHAHPGPTQTVRAHEYARSRGGSAPTVLSVLSQLHADKCWLVASLGGAQEARALASELEEEGVSTRYCKVWEGASVPSAWILHADNTNTQSVINHNPLPDIPHEEFVSLLGPLLVPDHYPTPELPLASPPLSPTPLSPTSGPPFEWIHFEGRSVKTTLSNLQGLDGLARERRWRSQCVFSVDVGRRAKQGIEALIPHADVVFLNRHYAQAQSSAYANAPRAFLLALTRLAPPHALLVAYWGVDGAAVLSVPTREYFQSSGWTGPPTPVGAATLSPSSVSPSANTTPSGQRHHHALNGVAEAESVRSGSGFWAAGHDSSHGSSAFSATQLRQLSGQSAVSAASVTGEAQGDDSGDDSDGTEIAAGSSTDGPVLPRGKPAGQQPQQELQEQQHQQQDEKVQAERTDDVGAQDAFIAGMIFALTRRDAQRSDGGRWKLDECLRFATEFAGRKARRRTWDGLREEMAQAGWFDG